MALRIDVKLLREYMTMHLAEIAKIKVVPHTLIRLKDGTLGYLTKESTVQQMVIKFRWRICVSSPKDRLSINTRVHMSRLQRS